MISGSWVSWRESLPLETRLLLDVMGAAFGSGAPPQPVPELASGVDWSKFLASVRHHRVAPLMGPVRAGGGTDPDAVGPALAALQVRATRRILALGAETLHVISAFEAAGLDIVLLKGPALSVQLYGDPWRRSSRDIDILVRPQDQTASLALLNRLGYGRSESTVARDMNALAVYHERRPFPVEVHLHLGDDDRMFPCALLRPFDNAVKVAIGGRPVPTLAPEAAVVYAAYHGTRHLWRRLCWLGDMAAALAPGRFDWDAVFALARHMGTEVHLALALVLVHELIGPGLPPALTRDAKLLERARRAARALRPVLADSGIETDQAAFLRFGRLRHVWWNALLYRRPQARWAALAVQARPSRQDRALIALPPALDFLYYGVRLFRVIRTFGMCRPGNRP